MTTNAINPSAVIRPNTIWYAVQDSHILERVQVLDGFLSLYGRFVIYRPIDWPDSGQPRPLACARETFLAIYTPQESEPCEPPPENSFSKTSSQPLPRWFSALRKFWPWGIERNNSYW